MMNENTEILMNILDHIMSLNRILKNDGRFDGLTFSKVQMIGTAVIRNRLIKKVVEMLEDEL